MADWPGLHSTATDTHPSFSFPVFGPNQPNQPNNQPNKQTNYVFPFFISTSFIHRIIFISPPLFPNPFSKFLFCTFQFQPLFRLLLFLCLPLFFCLFLCVFVSFLYFGSFFSVISFFSFVSFFPFPFSWSQYPAWSVHSLSMDRFLSFISLIFSTALKRHYGKFAKSKRFNGSLDQHWI